MRGAARALLGRVVWSAQRLTPRLEQRYARLRASTGLAPGASAAEHEQRLSGYYNGLEQAIDRLADRPGFDIVVVGVERARHHLAEALASIELQVYPDWRVVLPDVAGPGAAAAAGSFESAHPGRVVRGPGPFGPPDSDAPDSDAPDSDAPEQTRYVVLLDARDRLLPHALAEVVRWLAANRSLGRPEPGLLYGDDRLIDEAGDPHGEPRLRPGWSPLLLLAGPYPGRLLLLHPRVAARMPVPQSAWQAALLGAGDPATVVGHVPHLLCQARIDPTDPGTAHPGPADPGPAQPGPAHPGSTDPGPLDPDPGTAESPAQAAYCAARGWPLPHGRSPVSFLPPDPAPKVSILVPTRDRAATLRTCLESVLSRSDYPDFEVVVVDNGSSEPAAVAYLRRIGEHPRVMVLRRPGRFNFAALNNAAAAAAAGSVLVLLNNDTEVLDGGWVRALAGLAVLPGVGAVGPQLRYPDGRIQHAGLVGLAEAGTGHAFVARPPDAHTPLDLLNSTREVLAVTGACLAVTAARYAAAGGLDERLVPNDSGDVDFCLRLRQQGLVNVYTPATVLVHHESVTREPSFLGFERFWLQQRWPADLLHDPYLNPNLAKSSRMTPDYRFPVADVPGALMARWLERRSVRPPGGDHGHGEAAVV